MGLFYRAGVTDAYRILTTISFLSLKGIYEEVLLSSEYINCFLHTKGTPSAFVRKMKRLMAKTHSRDEKLPSMTFGSMNIPESQSFKRSQQTQQQRGHPCFFYRLRQKRKQLRLRQGQHPVDLQRRHPRVIDRNDRREARETLSPNLNVPLAKQKKYVTGIVGSSLARHISVENIECDDQEVRLRFKSGSDCADALAWLKSNEGQKFMRSVNQLVFVLGTNDVHRVGATETVRRIDRTVEEIRRLYPGVNIIWQLLQRRTRKTWLLPEGQPVLIEIAKCNTELLKLAAQRRFDTVQPDIPITDMYDGLHPTARGVRLMEAAIRDYLNENRINYSFPPTNVFSLSSSQ